MAILRVADTLRPCLQGGRVNFSARLTLALAHFFFFFSQRVYKAGRVTLPAL